MTRYGTYRPGQNPHRRSLTGRLGGPFGILLVVLLVVFLVGACEYHFAIQERTVSFTVNDKAVIATNGNNGHQYTIYTNKGTFRDGDNLWHAKFSSSDLYGALKIGRSYTCRVTGYRIPLFSKYPNLITCQTAAGRQLP